MNEEMANEIAERCDEKSRYPFDSYTYTHAHYHDDTHIFVQTTSITFKERQNANIE